MHSRGQNLPPRTASNNVSFDILFSLIYVSFLFFFFFEISRVRVLKCTDFVLCSEISSRSFVILWNVMGIEQGGGRRELGKCQFRAGTWKFGGFRNFSVSCASLSRKEDSL